MSVRTSHGAVVHQTDQIPNLLHRPPLNNLSFSLGTQHLIRDVHASEKRCRQGRSGLCPLHDFPDLVVHKLGDLSYIPLLSTTSYGELLIRNRDDNGPVH